MARRIELSPQNQQILEERYHNKIRQCNTNIRNFNKVYNDWENAGTRRHSQYTREEYKKEFIDYWYKERRYWIELLQMVRQGYILE